MSMNTDFSFNYSNDSHQSIREKSPGKKAKSGPEESPSQKHRSLPAMRSPDKSKHSPVTSAHQTGQSVDEKTVEQFKSPVGLFSLRTRSIKSPSDKGDSPRSARSPGSPRSEHEVMSSRRHRIDSPMAKRAALHPATSSVSIQSDVVTSGVTGASTDTCQQKNIRQRLSSPPNTISLNQPSPEQMNALADLWIYHLLGSPSDQQNNQTGLLTDAKIKSLGRTDGKAAVDTLHACLSGLKISADKQGKVSLSSLLNSMLANHLSQSDVGKTIRTMQATVLHANPKLASIYLDDLTALDDPEAENTLRQQMKQAAAAQASACVDVAFGSSRKLSECRLPPALLSFWKLLDARLVREAAKNPSLSPAQVLTARQNLGFDLLITRQMYPFALKPSVATAVAITEPKPERASADAALPLLATHFAKAMADAFLQAWPAFSSDAIAAFDA